MIVLIVDAKEEIHYITNSHQSGLFLFACGRGEEGSEDMEEVTCRTCLIITTRLN